MKIQLLRSVLHKRKRKAFWVLVALKVTGVNGSLKKVSEYGQNNLITKIRGPDPFRKMALMYTARNN